MYRRTSHTSGLQDMVPKTETLYAQGIEENRKVKIGTSLSLSIPLCHEMTHKSLGTLPSFPRYIKPCESATYPCIQRKGTLLSVEVKEHRKNCIKNNSLQVTLKYVL